MYLRLQKYVRQINDPVHLKILISPDEHGNLYVCDSKNSHIHVLSNGGEYLHSFGCDAYGSGVNMLSVPCGIYVASQYVYVTSNGNHTISVYTTEGEHVTTFGKEG